jgi:type IV secretory pathway component VirB8
VRKSKDFSQRINKKSEELSLTHIEKEVTHQPNDINVRNIFIIICYVMFAVLVVQSVLVVCLAF